MGFSIFMISSAKKAALQLTKKSDSPIMGTKPKKSDGVLGLMQDNEE